jgi:chemosensory pili system protein ChpA (sensor histidine kinase/response regulator)
MSTSSQVDPSTLGWVKTEIDETLKQARLALETFADDKSDDTRIRFCITHLHQVVGTLLMVELDGAAMLAKETEALAEAIYAHDVEASDPVIESLVRGILSIPDYLARLQFGQPDSPIRLLPLVNELRAAHNAEPISEGELFKPDLSVRPPESKEGEKLKDREFTELVRQLRHPFQQALLSWLRESGERAPLETMIGIADRLRDGARLAPVEQLFWVAAALLEAFADKGLEAGNERKRLVSRTDQILKKIIDGAEKSAIRSAAEDLVRSMLYEIGQAHSRSERVSQLKQAFHLEQMVPQVSEGLEDLPTPEVMKSVGEALGDEIGQVQDILSGYFDEEQPEANSLEPLIEPLQRMSSTLELLGVRPLKEITDELIEVTRAIADGRIADPESASMPMARALLLVEQSTREMQGSPLAWKQQVDDVLFVLRSLYHEEGETPAVDGLVVSDAALSDIEFRQLASVVGEEVRANLASVEEALEAFAANSGRVELLAPIPQNLSQIEGALQILAQDRAADFTRRTMNRIEELLDGRLVASPGVLDGIAVSVGTIGAYMDGLQFNRGNLESLLDSADHDMEAAIARGGDAVSTAPREQTLATLAGDIHATVSQWASNSDEVAVLDTLKHSLYLIGERAKSENQETVSQIAAEMSDLVQIIDTDPDQLNDDIVDTMRQSAEQLLDLCFKANEGAPAPASAVPTTPVVAAAPAAPAPKAPVSPDIDEEIMEIFIEDARDCLQNIQRDYPAWKNEPENLDLLKELRRNYHTLKGSGRMVGASDISELAWAIENMLNKVRDRKVSHAPGMFALLEEVQAILPAMIAHLEGGPYYNADIDGMRARADEFAAGQAPVSAASPESPAAAEPEPTPEVSPAGPSLPEMDSTLRQIFVSEARGHLTTLEQEIRTCRSAGGCAISASLQRAIHTLRGSARSVGLQSMSDACGNMEHLLHELEVAQHHLTTSHLDLLDRIHDEVDRLIILVAEGNRDGSGVIPRLQQLARDVAATAQAELASLSPAGSQSPEPVRDEAPVDPAPVPAPEPAAPATIASPPPPAAAPAEPSEEVDHIDAELVEIFLEEAVDLLRSMDQSVQRWRDDPNDLDARHSLKRALHTIKGGARMAGAMTMGNLSHNTETLLERVEQGQVQADKSLLDLLDEVHDTLASMLEQIQAGKPVSSVSVLNRRVTGFGGTDQPSAGPTIQAEAPAPTPVSPPAETSSTESAAPASTPVAPVPTPPPAETAAAQTPSEADRRDRPDRRRESRGSTDRRTQAGQIRVRTTLLNDLVNYAGEVSISRSRMEQQIFGFRENLGELHRNVSRFRDQLRELEIQSESQILFRAERSDTTQDADFDPLEFDRFSKLQQLSRSLTESLHDLTSIQSSLGNYVGEAEAVLQQQARLNTDLQEGLMRTRMVEFSTQAARLRHIVRQTSRELGKEVELDLSGADVDIDRNVLERMIGPFEHMIRNAIDHGIEDADGRRKAGKADVGRIRIGTAQEGSEVVIRFADDGAGLHVDAIREKAIERGMMSEDATFSDEEIVQFILIPGFSTATTITHLSGRGVGMDVVHSEVKQLGGTMSVDSEPGVGTTFVIRLPLTLSITQALMIRVGDQQFAVPISMVENIIEVMADTLDQVRMGDKPMLHHGEKIYPFAHLADSIGIPAQSAAAAKVPVLLIRSGSRDMALQVDGLVGTQEVVIKPVSPQISSLPGIAGATILGDGRVVLILDLAGLLLTDEVFQVSRAVSRQPVASPEATETTPEAPAAARRPTVMVVDDSLTVRKVTSRALQKHGIEFMVAKDGQDAIEQLQRGDQLPDVMLVDIEMPRMDGYELTQRVRSDSRLKHIPIIMITSRAGEKHRKRAFDLGVNDYMSKPYQEETLMATIKTLLPAGVEL